jgi:hypothetical protein
MTSYCLQYVAGFYTGKSVKPLAEEDFCTSASSLPKIDVPLAEITNTTVTESLRQAWHAHFKFYGTHYLHLVHFGGKMITTIVISEDDVSKLQEKGVDMKVSAELLMAAGDSVSGSIGGEYGKTKEGKAKNAIKNVDAKKKTYVFGGTPPAADPEGPEAFGLWAATVKDRPMPVRYELTPQSVFDCMDTNSYDIMVADYMMYGAYDDKEIGKVPDGINGGPPEGAKLRVGQAMKVGERMCSPDLETCLYLTATGALEIKNTVYTPVTLFNSGDVYCPDFKPEEPQGACKYGPESFVSDGLPQIAGDPEFFMYFTSEDQGRRSSLLIGMNPYPQTCHCEFTLTGPVCKETNPLPKKEVIAPKKATSADKEGAAEEGADEEGADEVDRCKFTVLWDSGVGNCKDSLVSFATVEDGGDFVVVSDAGDNLWKSGTSDSSGSGVPKPAKFTGSTTGILELSCRQT